ncbi:MAG: hypothetical protein B6243_03815 [Anaerolineaceae bacterium 4572_5.2]|nr:MAG: hypothetical protein B6243_03815 [Anaerolineaceae bacterium 4572_5.2]
MKKLLIPLTVALAMLLLGIAALAQQPKNSAANAKIAPHLLNAFEKEGQSEFFIVLSDKADLSQAARYSSKADKGRYVYNSLQQTAQRSQAPLKDWLDKRSIEYRSFYIINALLVKGDYGMALTLAKRDDVLRLEANPAIHNDLPSPLLRVEAPRSVNAIEPNITYVNADDVWNSGFTGQGVVVGGQDTGYDWDHPALINQYRGWDGSTANHDYNWHDSIHETGSSCGADSLVPCDDHGHGTHTMGTAVGNDGGSNQIGVAPGAKWIGCRNMNAGVGTPDTYIECFEFFLAPYPVGGDSSQGDPSLAPDVTVNSWGCPPSEGCSATSLQAAVEAQVAAGIMTVVSAGNAGNSCSSVDDPAAIYEASYTVGALYRGTDNLASFSSRGPVTVDGSNRRKPDISAPGTSIRSSRRGGGYTSMQGTSMAGPHVSGAVALLWSAVPQLTNNITATENYLNDNAVHISSTACSSSGVPNNLFGYGRLDVLAAVQAAKADYPTAIFTHTTPIILNQTAVFTNLSTGQTPITFTWSFGDGSSPESTGTLLLPAQHTYTAGGDYTVTLTATNQYGDSVVQQLVTVAVSPTARFTYTTPVYKNLPVVFTNLSAGADPITCTWDFGDGQPNTVVMDTQPLARTYANIGMYTVALTVTNSQGNDSISRTVTVQPPVYTLTINTVGGGSTLLNPAGPVYDEGVQVVLTAHPAVGWLFDSWSGSLVGGTDVATVTMDSNKFVTATFKLAKEATQSDLSGSYKHVNLTNVEQGDILTYTLILRNSSAVTATATLTDTLPTTYTDYIEGSAWVNSGSITVSAGQLRWTGEVISGTPVTIKVALEVIDDMPTGTKLSNKAYLDDNQGNVLELEVYSIYNSGYRMTINGGALYTNVPTVTLKLWWGNTAPAIETMRIGNDGGFISGTTWITVTSIYSDWVILTYGHIVLPRTVYAMFRNDSGLQYGPVQDDIIFDPVSPVLNNNDVAVISTTLKTGNSDNAKSEHVIIRVRSRDDNSGVNKVEISHSGDFSDCTADGSADCQSFTVVQSVQDFNWTLQNSGLVYVRTVDRAGNVSDVTFQGGVAIYLPIALK